MCLPAGVAQPQTASGLPVGHEYGQASRLLRRRDSAAVREGARGAVSSIAFDRTGTAIVTGGQKGTAFVWDARTLSPTPLPAPGGQVIGASFSAR